MERSIIFGAKSCSVLLVEKSHKTKAALQASLLGIFTSALKSLGFVFFSLGSISKNKPCQIIQKTALAQGAAFSKR